MKKVYFFTGRGRKCPKPVFFITKYSTFFKKYLMENGRPVFYN